MSKKKTETQRNSFEGITVDVSGISDKLTDRAKRFVFWYCFPGTDTFQNKKRAAIAAGYASRNASISGYRLCKNPEVVKEIEKVSKSLNSETIDTLYRRYVNALETRAFFDPADFISGSRFKPIEEIPMEKRLCLEQAVIDTKKGEVMGYQFGSRRAAMSEIKELYEKEHTGGDGDYDGEEETIEVIMERLALRKTIRKEKDAMSATANLIRRPKECDLITEL